MRVCVLMCGCKCVCVCVFLWVAVVPEILRGGMTTVVLQLLTMGVENITDFDFMDPPSADALVAALEELCKCGLVLMMWGGPGLVTCFDL